MDTMMMPMDSVQQDYNTTSSSSSSSNSNQNCFGLMDALPPYPTNSSNTPANISYNYAYAPNTTSSKGGAELMRSSSNNSNYSLIRHHSAPSSVLQDLLNDEDHDLLYKFNPPGHGHGGGDGAADDDQFSAFLDMDSDYNTLIANIDNLVPYPLPSILEQDDNSNPGMINSGPDHDHIISSNDIRNSNNMDMKRRRRRRRPPLPFPSPSSPSPSPSPSSSGHELIRHSSSPAHLLSRIAMEEMHEMEMEMEMEKKKKKIIPTMNISLTAPTAPITATASAGAATISGNELYSYKNLKQHRQQQMMRNQINHQSRSGAGIMRSSTDNSSCSAGISSSSPPPPAPAYSNSSSPSGHGQIMSLHYNFNGATTDVITPSPPPPQPSLPSLPSSSSSPSSSLSSSSSLSPSLLPSSSSSSANVLIRQSSSPAGLLSQLCLDEHQMSMSSNMSRKQRPVPTDGHQIKINSQHLSSAAAATDQHHHHHHHQQQQQHGRLHRDDLLLNSNSHPLLNLDREQLRAGLLSPIDPHSILLNSSSNSANPPPALAMDQADFHNFDDCNMEGMASHEAIHSASSPDGSAGTGGGGALANCQARAKRGHATHPRSIAERVRRTKISERIKKLQDLVPNLDKQANTADMLDEVVEYVKLLQWKIQELSLNRSNTVICEECGPTIPAKTTPPR